ncbi:mhpA protein [Sphaerotilus natans subsp. natans DSM 6575]|uniref:MhpA protein n=1 Tax=Sphaerotilus natans subsp. natans DSM 6575 TaxID=1286631 RepID=A0A059KLA5_9BURK|nr:FAD-dependent oxidoreductase [Sphaerotilus natans]KDB51974.1 mhpA protein [Sphaerotilus natans subsp. natans DSM 6575]SIR01209.1 3-(3-hydroxy-phenyl)propionate hydroxylase [Sphaerotilus natans]
MHSTYSYPKFDAPRAPELDAAPGTAHRPVVVVGAGPVGLSVAIDLAQRGQPVLLLDDDDTVSVGSRGLCYAKRTLEILDRLGCGQPVVDKGVTWNVGRTFLDTEEVFNFDLLPEAGHERPGMVNLQQYYLEEYLVARARELPGLEMRFRHKVTQVEPHGAGATLQVETPHGAFTLACDWLVVCDGARSPIRCLLGHDIEGRIFQDRFLIADVVMKADFPAERWFWFDPPFHRGQSVLLHREADNVWRIDFQLGWDADPDEERKPERVIPRIRAMLGDERPFELEWVSVYTFQCRRMTSFRHGRVLFAGDSAHQVSPFGARGANSGIQDADNLGWKLAAVLRGHAPDTLLDSYHAERAFAADENLLNSTRSTDFITPKSAMSRRFRNAVLGLAREHAFARALVNSGRLSVPATLGSSDLVTPDRPGEDFEGWMLPGAPMDDAPVAVDGQPTWLLRQIADGDFTLLVFGDAPVVLPDDLPVPVGLRRVQRPGSAAAAGDLIDTEGHLTRRYDGRPGTVYLLRPDQHVAARWRAFDLEALRAALRRSLALQ